MASVSPAMFEAGRSLRRAQGPTGLCRCPGNSSLRRRRDPSRSRFASPSAAGGSRSRGTGRLSAKGLRRVVCGAVEDSYTLELTEENVENVLDEVSREPKKKKKKALESFSCWRLLFAER